MKFPTQFLRGNLRGNLSLNLNYYISSRIKVTSVGSVFNDTRKVKVLSLPETVKEKSTFRAKALRRELVLHQLVLFCAINHKYYSRKDSHIHICLFRDKFTEQFLYFDIDFCLLCGYFLF